MLHGEGCLELVSGWMKEEDDVMLVEEEKMSGSYL